MGRLALDGALAGGAAGAAAPDLVGRCSSLVGIAYPFVLTGGGYIDAAANAYTYVLLALGLNIVVGFSGLLDLGYAAFFAIGAYTYGAAASGHIKIPWSDFWTPFLFLGQVQRVPVEGGTDLVQFQFSFWVMLVVGALVCACFGVLFGAPTLRLRGDYLAIVTLGFGEIVPVVARNWDWFTNGAQGMGGIRTPKLFGFDFGFSPLPYYFLGLALVAVAVFVSFRLQESRVGRAWMAIREDELAAGAMGVNHVRYKLLAFAIGAVDRRAGRDLLRRQAHHRHPGDVPVPGVGHDPGHGRARRHGLGAGGRAGGAPPRVSPVGDPPGAHASG